MIAHRFEKRRRCTLTLKRWTQDRSPTDDKDEERRESFQRQRSGTLIDKLVGVLIGMTLAAVVLSLLGQITGQLFTGPLSGGPDQRSGRTNETPGSSAPANETGALPKAETDQGARGSRARLSATARPSAPAPPNQVAIAASPEAVRPKATPPKLVGSHRAELVRKPVSRGWGDSYAVRLLDPAGQPVVVGEVLLVVRMADGTVENVPMGALAEPGTYRGTVPTGRSTPVDLRVRVSTGEKFVEVPVRP